MTDNVLAKPTVSRSLPTSFFVGLATALVLCVLYTIIGQIPADNGAGWDGRVYLQYLEMLGHGDPVNGDPYRTIRLSGFLHLIAASALGASIDTLVAVQTAVNIILISIAAALFHDTLNQLGVSRRTALLTLATTWLAWPLLIVPFFYPVLSDNMALFAICLSLWCWTRDYQKTLYLLLVWSVWLMPGLFLVPLLLAAMPRQGSVIREGEKRLVPPVILAAASTMLFIPVFYSLLGGITDSEISAHGAHLDGVTALPELRSWSAAALLTGVGMIFWLAARALCDSSLWRSVDIRRTGAALGLLVASAVAMYVLIDWNSGFKGPPLSRYLLMQSLAAPFKPLVAHFTSFGPVIVMAMIGIIAWTLGRTPAMPKALLICMLGFMPLLIVGSESRQWIGILPVAGLVAALSPFSLTQRMIGLFFAIVLALPSLWLKEQSYNALSNGMSFQSEPWQYYFGRQGPWMSVQVYALGAMLLGVYSVMMTAAWCLRGRTGA